jgi:hypothetical protein
MSKGEFSIKLSMALASSLLAPVGQAKVNLKILSDLVQFERIKTLDWGEFIVDQLAIGVRPGSEEVKGYVYLFHVSSPFLLCTEYMISYAYEC